MTNTIQPKPLSPEQREEIIGRHQASTPGRYEWRVDTDSKNVKLISRTGMMPVVMAFWRWGMGRAAPVFRDAENDLLRRVEYWIPDRDRFPYGPIDHPDARAIAHSWADREALLSHIAFLEEQIVKKDFALQGASRALGDYHGGWVEGMPGHQMDFAADLSVIADALAPTRPGEGAALSKAEGRE